MVGFEVINFEDKYRVYEDEENDGSHVEYDLVNPGISRIFDYSDIVDIVETSEMRDYPPTHQISVTVPCWGKNVDSFFCFGYIQYIFYVNLREEHDMHAESLSDELHFFDSLKEKFAECANNDLRKIENAFMRFYSHLPDLTPKEYVLKKLSGREEENYEPEITVDRNYDFELVDDKLEQIGYNISSITCFPLELVNYHPKFCVRGQYKNGDTVKGNTPECAVVNFFLFSFRDLTNCKYTPFVSISLNAWLTNSNARKLIYNHTFHAREPNRGGKMDPGLDYINNFEIKLV